MKKLLKIIIPTFIFLFLIGGAFAYFSGSASLIDDGNMEAVGVGDWTPNGTGCVLTKSTTNCHRGSQSLKITGSGGTISNPAAIQYGLVAGKTYRATGWAAGDGTQRPSIYEGGVGTVWTGITSTDWQYFDFTFVALSNNIRVLYFGSTAGDVWFDDVRVVEYKGKQQGSATIIADGNMEAADTSAWVAGAGATLSKQTTDPKRGTRYLRMYRNGSGATATQVVLTVGKTYRTTGWARGDGTGVPLFITGGTYTYGGPSTDWQYFDFIITAVNSSFKLSSGGPAAHYAEYDDVRCVEIIG